MNEHEPVAIVGAACRLPGASNVTAYWKLLLDERDVVTPAPRDRLDMEAMYDRYQAGPGMMANRFGGFIDGIDKFDAGFFNVSPYVALRLDPHQRLLMENVWEAIEDAGIPAATLAGSNTGVYASAPPNSYWDLLQSADIHDIHAALSSDPGTGAAGLISHHLDLRGPSMGIGAFCASSLLAVHFGYRAIRDGDVDLAIVCAANLQYAPGQYLSRVEADILSSVGRCRFGDSEADGYVPGDGVVSIVLKPLSAALLDGDRIYATILGSGVRGDGRSGGTMLAPGVDGQESMLRAAYRDAAVDPSDVDYVEAHGSATQVGDPIELTALRRVLGTERPVKCLIGSVKSNIGHSEVCAGLAGLLKTALAVHHRTVPATLHVRTANPLLAEPEMPIALATETVPWPSSGRQAIAGVSSFGMTGTNVHVVLAESPRASAPETTETLERPYLLPLSAHTPGALTTLADRYAETLSTRVSSVRAYDVCFSAGTRRTAHHYRTAYVGADRHALLNTLRCGTGIRSAGRVPEQPRVVFVFPGQGSQWPGMCRDLLAGEPVFTAAFTECAKAIEAETGWSCEPVLTEAEDLSAVDHVQPVLWAVQVALARLWQHWGVRCDLVIGQSMGEIAAAVVADALTVAEGAAIVCRRSRLLAEHPMHGAMWTVGLDEDSARQVIEPYGDKICVAAMNSPHSTVLSGDPGALADLADSLRGTCVFCKQIQVDYASHGPEVDPLRPALVAALDDLAPKPGRVPIHSTTLDRVVDGAGFDADYWADNLRRPVQLAAAVRSAMTDRRTIFVEISPHPILLSAIEDSIDDRSADAIAVPSQQRGERAWVTLLTSLGTAFTYGCEPDWQRVYPGGRFVPLPGYPWQGKRFWVDANGIDVPLHSPEDGAPVRITVRADPPEDSIERRVAHRAAEVLALSPEEIDPDLPLSMAGLDSVLAVRLRASMKQDLDLHVPARDFLGGMTLAALTRLARAATAAPA